MWRSVRVCTIVGLCLLGSSVAVLGAAEPFHLPECVADLGADVVLNVPILDAMIRLAEPGGSRVHRSWERLFIVVKHYLERSQGLLRVARQDPNRQALLLTQACAPFPQAAAHIRDYIAGLTVEQNQALVSYRDLVWPHLPPSSQGGHSRATAGPGTVARIPAGVFKRGDGQSARLDAFTIDVYEVTNAQYGQFIEAGGYTTKEWWSADGWTWLQPKQRQQPSYWDNPQLNAPDQPVIGVAWYEADAYCRWAGKTLPTELQWEKACRGAEGRAFPWGHEPLAEADTAAPGQVSFTAPVAVGQTPHTQSPYGVHDLAGNVLEWTRTRRDGGQIVLCGGSGDQTTSRVGCGVRYTLLPGISANFIGFRCQSTVP